MTIIGNIMAACFYAGIILGSIWFITPRNAFPVDRRNRKIHGIAFVLINLAVMFIGIGGCTLALGSILNQLKGAYMIQITNVIFIGIIVALFAYVFYETINVYLTGGELGDWLAKRFSRKGNGMQNESKHTSWLAASIVTHIGLFLTATLILGLFITRHDDPRIVERLYAVIAFGTLMSFAINVIMHFVKRRE